MGRSSASCPMVHAAPASSTWLSIYVTLPSTPVFLFIYIWTSISLEIWFIGIVLRIRTSCEKGVTPNIAPLGPHIQFIPGAHDHTHCFYLTIVAIALHGEDHEYMARWFVNLLIGSLYSTDSWQTNLHASRSVTASAASSCLDDKHELHRSSRGSIIGIF